MGGSSSSRKKKKKNTVLNTVTLLLEAARLGNYPRLCALLRDVSGSGGGFWQQHDLCVMTTTKGDGSSSSSSTDTCKRINATTTTTEMRHTALTMASRHGRLRCVQRLLLVPDIDVNARSRDGESALSHACFHGHAAVAAALLADETKQINANLADTWGSTALHSACERSMFECLVHLLRSRTARKRKRGAVDIDAVNVDGETALMIACRVRNVAAIDALLQLGVEASKEETKAKKKVTNKQQLDKAKEAKKKHQTKTTTSVASSIVAWQRARRLAPARIDITNKSGKTALQLCRSRQCRKLVEGAAKNAPARCFARLMREQRYEGDRADATLITNHALYDEHLVALITSFILV
jgi:ankyrin repeat protein